MLLRGLLALGIILGGGGARLLAQTPTPTPVPPPAWWSASPPLIRSTDPDQNNYRPANLGQLKNFALHARAHLNDRLAGLGGAGTAIEDLVAGWAGPVANNYRPINLGQLKNVADKFYARLDAVGFDYKAQLTAAGYPAGRWSTIPGTSHPRPWSQATAPAANYAPANLGQLKMLFSFDLAGWSPLPPGEDQDGDGIPNQWETDHGLDPLSEVDGDLDPDDDGLTNLQEYQLDTDPQDFWNAQTPMLTIVGGNNQGDFAGLPISRPLKVKLSNQRGTAKSGATIVFAILSGGGTLIPVSGGLTDATGVASANLTLPNAAPGTAITVRATFTLGTASASVNFEATIGDPDTYPSAGWGTNAGGAASVTLIDGDTKAVIQWEDKSNNETAYYVDRTDDGETWTRRATLPANSESYTDTGLTPGRGYYYRITIHNSAP